MEYFILNTAGDLNDRSLCLVSDAPEDIGIHSYRLSRGVSAANHFPDDAKIYLRDENPGIKLAGLLGNTEGYFLASTTAKQVIEELCPDIEIEFFPFTLYNHKRRVHSTDYLFINPLGGLDCLNDKASGAEYDEDGELDTIDEFVLDPAKLTAAPHLFRILADPGEYVISQELGDTLAARGVTNVRGDKLRQEPTS